MNREKSPAISEKVVRIQNLDPDQPLKEHDAGTFPDFIREPLASVGNFVSTVFNVVCDASWVFFTTLAILYGPIVFEAERQRDPHAQADKTVQVTQTEPATEANQSS